MVFKPSLTATLYALKKTEKAEVPFDLFRETTIRTTVCKLRKESLAFSVHVDRKKQVYQITRTA